MHLYQAIFRSSCWVRSNFGFAISAENNVAGFDAASIDHIGITVHYTGGGGTTGGTTGGSGRTPDVTMWSLLIATGLLAMIVRRPVTTVVRAKSTTHRQEQ